MVGPAGASKVGQSDVPNERDDGVVNPQAMSSMGKAWKSSTLARAWFLSEAHIQVRCGRGDVISLSMSSLWI